MKCKSRSAQGDLCAARLVHRRRRLRPENHRLIRLAWTAYELIKKKIGFRHRITRMMVYTFEVTGRQKKLIKEALRHFPKPRSSTKMEMEFDVILDKIENLKGATVPSYCPKEHGNHDPDTQTMDLPRKP